MDSNTTDQSRPGDRPLRRNFRDTPERTMGNRTLVNVTKDLPDTPTTTVSAMMGHGPAVTEEGATRAAAEQLRKDSKAGQKAQHKKSSSSDLKKVLRNLKLGMKRGRATEEDTREETGGNELDRLYITKDFSTPSLLLSQPQQPAHFSYQPATFGMNFETTRPSNRFEKDMFPFHNYLRTDLQSPAPPQHVLSPYSGSGHIRIFPNAANAANAAIPTTFEPHAMSLSGQIPAPGPSTSRLPSTFLMPTNNDSYAVSGRRRLVTGQHITSHHANVHHIDSELNTPGIVSPITTTLSIPSSRPLSSFDRDTVVISGVSFTLGHRDTYLEDAKRHSIELDRTEEPVENERRRGSSVPAHVEMRGSAVPAPLKVQKAKKKNGRKNAHAVAAAGVAAAATPTAPVGQTHGRIKEEWFVAAFDGVHQHLEAVEKKMGRLEEKVDRVLALLSARGGPVDTQQRRQQQQREIRGNLTAVPPHIPFGGMEEWYAAVRR